MPHAELQNGSPDTIEEDLWRDACLAITLMAVGRDRTFPKVLVRGSNDAVFNIWLDRFTRSLEGCDFLQLPAGIDTHGLLGGLDIAATLASGRQVMAEGLLSRCDGQMLVISLSAGLEEDILAPLLSAIDENRFGVLMIDRSDEDRSCPEALSDRMTFHLDLNAVSYRTVSKPVEINSPKVISSALCDDAELTDLCNLALGFGLTSMRPAMQAVQVAIDHARLRGSRKVEQADVSAAIRLSLLNRAIALPDKSEQEEQDQQENPPDQSQDDQPPDNENENDSPSVDAMEDMDIESAEASLPPELLQLLTARLRQSPKKQSVGKRGSRKYSFRRGRPVASVKRNLTSRFRLDLIATLRTAAPWQTIRKVASQEQRPVHIRPSDFHVKRYRQQTETTAIFVVDASGSTALNRLNEAKGAIEMLLAETYARRDHVALIAVKGREAETILPPTRSLVRAKRQLSGLRGGGGTPLADGLKAAMDLYEEEQRRGRSASVIILTDGSANVDLSGEGGRAQAGEDALSVARNMAALGVSCLVIDVNRLPNNKAAELAEAMAGNYVPMPFASSTNISNAVRESRAG